MTKEEEVLIHPSFGQIQFSRINSTGNRFYGSELPQEHYIEMRLYNSEIIRTLTSDRYHNTNTLVEVRMTANQFAELITSMNYGSGIPCTIETLPGQRVEQLPAMESQKEFIHRKFQERMKAFAAKIADNRKMAKAIIAKKTLSKSDQDALNWQLDWIVQETSQNIPFFAECFQEQMDKVVVEAKSEVENAILHKITTLGLERLHEQNKLLPSQP